MKNNAILSSAACATLVLSSLFLTGCQTVEDMFGEPAYRVHETYSNPEARHHHPYSGASTTHHRTIHHNATVPTQAPSVPHSSEPRRPNLAPSATGNSATQVKQSSPNKPVVVPPTPAIAPPTPAPMTAPVVN